VNAGHVELGDTRAEDVHTTPNISLGRIVHYTLTEQDANQVNGRRDTPAYSNNAVAGQVFPAIAVRVWGPKCANLQVFLDGNDTLWKTSATEDPNLGFGNSGFWHWPERS
jgi:hypothetical protein